MAARSAKDKQVASAQDVLEVDRVIHEPARLVIMAVLAACESADFVYLRHVTGLTQGNLSTHLTKLAEAGYVSIEKRFMGNKPNTLCRLTTEGIAAFKRYRAQMAQVVRD